MRTICWLLLALWCLTAIAVADVPKLISFQGRLTDQSTGNAVADGSYDLIFGLYAAVSGGSPVWTETHSSVPVSGGLYQVLLGSTTPFGWLGFFKTQYYLGIAVNGAAEMTPRYQLASAPSVISLPDSTEGLTMQALQFVPQYSGLTTSQGLLYFDGPTHQLKYCNGTECLYLPGFGGNVWKAQAGIDGDTVLVPRDLFGLGKAGNLMRGYMTSTQVNLGRYCTTGVNGALSEFCTVLGGWYNGVAGEWGTVAGGSQNSVIGPYGFIGGGGLNMVGDTAAVVAGGWDNVAQGPYSSIVGGYHNVANALYSAALGGNSDTAGYGPADTGSVICGGRANVDSARYTFIGGGVANRASSIFGTIAGGTQNSVGYRGQTDTAAFVGGGSGNLAMSHYSAISGGYNNQAYGEYSTVSGGQNNRAWANTSAIGGGVSNFVEGACGDIGGGLSNHVKTYGSAIGGGIRNTSGWDWPDTAAFVGGGWGNYIASAYATIGGGKGNTIYHPGDYSTIGGGLQNYATGVASVIGGGQENSNAGNWCVIPGGLRDSITSAAFTSMVYGYEVYCAHPYRVMLFNGTYYGALRLNRDDRIGASDTFPIQVGTNSANGNDAYLTSGGVWTNASSRAYKDRFQPLDGSEVLGKIADMDISGWYYKNTNEYHIWPFAEDFYQAFGTGVANKSDASTHLAAGDVAGVGLVAIQELARHDREKAKREAELQRQIDDLQTQSKALYERIRNLEEKLQR